MILKIKKPNSTFLNFMLIQEADGDEPPKKNQKIIKLKSGDGRRTDLSKGAEIEDDTSGDEGDTGDDTSGDDEDFSDGAEMDGDDTSGDTEDDTSGDDEDFSDGAEMDGDDDSSDTGDDTSGDEGDNTSDDTENDTSTNEQIRKYTLYRKFIKLNDILTDNIDSLSTTMSDNPDINILYKRVVNSLKETNNFLSEYMIIKFQNSSYIQSMLFYQRILAIIDINLNSLSDIKKFIIKNNKE